MPRHAPWAHAVTFALVAMAVEAVLWAFLYFRPTPFGKPFALDPAHYVFHAIYYGIWAQAWVALPFVLCAVLRERSSALARGLQLGITAALLLLGSIDRECQRFMGMHATRQWFETYASVDRTPEVVWNTLAADRAGAWSSLVGILLSLAYPLLALQLSSFARWRWCGKRAAWAFALAFMALPTMLWNVVPGGKLRQAKVRPSLLSVWREAARSPYPGPSAEALHDAVAAYQKAQVERDGRWIFSDPEHPLRRHYVGPVEPRPAKRPNFIVLQLETFRGKDMRSLNPAVETAPTPFLDALASAADSALFTRHYASGVPTVYAFMSIHAGLLSHPTRSIPAEATHAHIEGFPLLLRRAGYHTMHFTGSDPDWDSQRVWLDRWYDEVHFDPRHKERDRSVFRAAAARIRTQAGRGRPFLAYLVSISNHAPFALPETKLALPSGEHSTLDALHDTMHYTDDVVRELYASLRDEPWFDDTVWVITGDHGYDLGDRGEAGSHDNLRHETTWVPLILHGKDPRLPRGRQASVSSHLDLGPTLLELAGVREDHSFMGNSLVGRDCSASETVVLRSGHYSYESSAYSLFQAVGARPLVYAAQDAIQELPLARPPAAVVRRAATLAWAYQTTLVHAVDRDRVTPAPTHTAQRPGPRGGELAVK